METESLLNSLDTSGHFGHILSVEESQVLYNSLLILQNENHFRKIYFWGKIFGCDKDYYIAFGYTKDILHGRIYYYSMNCKTWGLLPQPTKNGIMLTPLASTKFIGDPSLVIDILIEKDETLIPSNSKRKQPEVKKLKEEDRLASTVHLIMYEVSLVPRGAVFKRPDGVNVENLSFEGLSTLDAREIKSFLHVRVPTQKINTNMLTRYDYNYATDFLDPLDVDIPEGSWMIQITPAEDMVILKSIYWPGFLFYHYLRSPRHGFVYFGHGKKSMDLPFMLSPFFTIN